MFTHLLVGTLLLALVCFGIGLLAGGPDLIGRRRRARKKLISESSPEASVTARPVIQPTAISRADMRIEP